MKWSKPQTFSLSERMLSCHGFEPVKHYTARVSSWALVSLPNVVPCVIDYVSCTLERHLEWTFIHVHLFLKSQMDLVKITVMILVSYRVILIKYTSLCLQAKANKFK